MKVLEIKKQTVKPKRATTTKLYWQYAFLWNEGMRIYQVTNLALGIEEV